MTETLTEAHWADHNDQHDEDHQYSDTEWAEIVARGAQVKINAAERVSETGKAFRNLTAAQQRWVQSLRAKIARLDLQVSAE